MMNLFISLRTSLPLLLILLTITIPHCQSIAPQCNDLTNYGYIQTTSNSVQMTVCMLKSQITQNCILYRSFSSTVQPYDLAQVQQQQCINKPISTFLAVLIENGLAYVPYSQRVNYCLKYRSSDSSLTVFTCGICYPEYRLNLLNRCVEKVPNCVSYQKYGLCIQCSSQYQLIGSSCVPNILQSIDPNCETSNRQSGKCIKCKISFVLAGDMCYDAILQKKTIDLLLGECNMNQVRTPLGRCVLELIHCAQYDQVSGLCMYCNSGFVFNDLLTECVFDSNNINNNNQLLQSTISLLCPDKVSFVNNIFKIINNKCVQVDKNCVDDSPSQSTGCVKCKEGYFSWSGRCYFIHLEETN